MHNILSLTEFVNTLYDLHGEDTAILAYAPEEGVKLKQRYWFDGIDMGGKTAYICVSAVRNNMNYPRRRKQDCTAAHVVMLDDIGTKAQVPPVEPTVILETSPGNCQYVYALDRYAFDTPDRLPYYESAIRALIEAGYGDPGSGTATRVYRIPGSVNQKPGVNGFETKVVAWNPERKWSLDALVEAFGVPVPQAKMALSQAPLSSDINDPIVDWLANHQFIRDESDEYVIIRCPWADKHSDGTKDEAVYIPLGRGEHPLYRGFNCFHEHCLGKRAPTFLGWVAEHGGPHVGVLGTREVSLAEFKQLVKEDRDVDPHGIVWAALPELFAANLPDCNKSGTKQLPAKAQLATVPNINAVCATYGIQLRYNLHSRRTEAKFNDANLAALYDSTFTLQCLIDGCQRIGMGNIKRVADVTNWLAEEHKYHPYATWLRSLTWDGQDRLAALTASVDIHSQFVDVWPLYLRRWLIQVVQAACGWAAPRQIGSVLVLSGPQGCGKTLWFKSLVPTGYFNEGVHLHLGGLGHKDAVMVGTANLLIELGELEVTFQRSSQGALKAFLTNTIDTYRPPHGTHVLDIPRTTVFCATVNRADFLMDETGDRRYWPVGVTACYANHEIDLNQLWAQVYQLWVKQENWWLSDIETARYSVLKSQFTATDAVTEMLHAYLARSLDAPLTTWRAMTVTEIAKTLELDTQKSTLSVLRYQIEQVERLGPRKSMVSGVRNAWLFPPRTVPGLQQFAGEKAKPVLIGGKENETTH